MKSLVDGIVRYSIGVLMLALVASGLGTAVLLHTIEVRAVDRSLFAAVAAYRHGGRWQAEHVRSPVEVSLASSETIPERWIEHVERTERPMLETMGDQRLLIAIAEEKGEEDEHDEQHRVIVARADRPTLARTVGAFSLAYGIASAAVALFASIGLRSLLRRAVAPLSRAVATIEGATSASVGTRVEPSGPSEVYALLSSVDALLSRRDDAFLAQRRFVATAAHELRTPVAAMLGEIDVALRRPREASDYEAVLATIREEVRGLMELFEGLLLLSRVDGGHAEQGRAREHVSALLTAAIARESPPLVARGGHLVLAPGPDPEISCNAALLTAAVGNLIRNAAVHAPGSTVRIETATEGRYVHITVEDDGPGFSKGESERGLGLGLPLAREIASRHGGGCVILPRERGTAIRLTVDRGDHSTIE